MGIELLQSLGTRSRLTEEGTLETHQAIDSVPEGRHGDRHMNGREPNAAAPVAVSPSGSRSRSRLLLFLAGPLSAAVATFVVVPADQRPFEVSLVVFAALAAVGAIGTREPEWAQVLPLMSSLTRLLMLVMSGAVVGALHLVGALSGVEGVYVAVVAGCAIGADAAAAYLKKRLARKPPVRVAIIGDARVAESLNREMCVARRNDRYQIVGRIVPTDEEVGGWGEVPIVGRLGGLAEAISRHDVDLVLLSANVPRMDVFEEVGRTCLHLPVRMYELSSFYENVFCHVASTEINAAWFQYILHPKYRAGSSRSERVLDLVMASIVAIFTLPLLGLLALLIRRDGGKALFRQTRIGEGGRPFTMYKLRTMSEGNADASWATAGDVRVTRIGALLRKSHLDELPQLLNVLRGDMSIVGPRPEQPQIVDDLETMMPFYSRRHLIKPGVTGWAQVRCGYAGSHAGSAWKLCHDLYYLKHRSLWLNMVIVLETVRTLFADRQYTARPMSVDFILSPEVAEAIEASAWTNVA